MNLNQSDPRFDRPISKGWLKSHKAEPTSCSDALDFFVSLSAVTIEELIGQWRGTELKTGHPFDGLLEDFGWYGKAFVSSEIVHPLVLQQDSGELYSLNANLIPSNLLSHVPKAAWTSWGRSMVHKSGPLLKTTKPTARLRRIEHQGVLSTAMIYDCLPIIDVFRKVDEDMVMGLMDMRDAEPYFFVLRREQNVGDFFQSLQKEAFH